MATNIKIKNFQSIKEADIDVEGFTILVGESSQGKSACLRAVNAACNNKFKQNFLRYGADTISVAINYGNDTTLEITKTKKESPTYKLNDIVFQKLNRTVPEEVNDFNNFGIIDYFEQKYPLNYFSQFSKPLLLEFSQKRILEILSSSKAYDDMNVASTNLNKHKEQNNGAFKQLSTMLSENKSQLSDLKKQKEDMQASIDKMRLLQNKLVDTEMDIVDINSLISNYNEYNNAINKQDLLVGIEQNCEKIEAIDKELSDISTLQSDIEALNTCNNKIDTLTKKLQILENCKNLYDKIKTFEVECNELSELNNLISISKQTKAKINTLESKLAITTNAMQLKQSIKECDNDINALNTLLELIAIVKSKQEDIKKKEYMVVNRICPVCGNKF